MSKRYVALCFFSPKLIGVWVPICVCGGGGKGGEEC